MLHLLCMYRECWRSAQERLKIIGRPQGRKHNDDRKFVVKFKYLAFGKYKKSSYKSLSMQTANVNFLFEQEIVYSVYKDLTNKSSCNC